MDKHLKDVSSTHKNPFRDSVDEDEQTSEPSAIDTATPQFVQQLATEPALAARMMRANFPNAPVTETEAGHFLQEEVPTVIAAVLMRIVDQVQAQEQRARQVRRRSSNA